ncbi:hypothetical protein Tco_1146312 [Tanacetum coccineum]
MGSSYHHMFVTWEKVPEIRRSRVKNYKMKYDDEGPSLTVNHALICEELSREELEKDLSERILILNKPRPIIETLKYGDRYKKVLDTITLDKLKLDGELELEEEEADEEMIREYKAIKEKKIPAEPMGMLKDVLCQIGVTMVLAKFLILDMSVDRTIPIIVGRSFLHTCGGIINTLKGTTSTFDGVCHQKFYVVEIQNKGEESDSDDKEEYYLKRDEMGRPFYGPNLISYFDRNDHMELALAIQDSINPFRKIYVWKKAVAFLGSLPVPLLHTDWMPKGSGDFVKEVGNGKWHTKIRVIDQYGNTFEQRQLEHTMTRLVLPDPNEAAKVRPWRKQCSHAFIMNFCYGSRDMLEVKVYEVRGQQEIFTSKMWRRLFEINEGIYTELCHKFYPTYTFDEVYTNDELRTNKVINFRLGGSGHTLTLLKFAQRLGLYHADEINDEGFEVCFQGGLCSDENFNARDYWLSISSKEELHLFRSLASTIRHPILRVLQKMITYGVCQRMIGYDKMQRNELWLMRMFECGLVDGKMAQEERSQKQRDSMICCWQFITRIAKRMGLLTNEGALRELIGPDGRLIVEDPALGVPRVAIPRCLRPSMQDLYDRMGNMVIHQGTLERMARRQSYHTNRCAELFEHVAGHYGYTMQGAYAPPGYDEKQQDDEE